MRFSLPGRCRRPAAMLFARMSARLIEVQCLANSVCEFGFGGPVKELFGFGGGEGIVADVAGAVGGILGVYFRFEGRFQDVKHLLVGSSETSGDVKITVMGIDDGG